MGLNNADFTNQNDAARTFGNTGNGFEQHSEVQQKKPTRSVEKNASDVAQHHYAAKNSSAAHVCVPEKICNSRPSFEFSMKDLRIKLTEIIANYKASKPLKMKKICGQNEERAKAINGGKRK